MTDTRSLAEEVAVACRSIGDGDSTRKGKQLLVDRVAALESERTKLQGELARAKRNVQHWQAETIRMSDGWKNSMLLRESLEDKLAAVGEIAGSMELSGNAHVFYWARGIREALATGAATNKAG